MCGIAGYVGKTQQAGPLILDSLAKMEYRGYDSTGMAVMEGGEIRVAKAPGRLSVLENMTCGGSTLPGTCGIGHTRWATHGVPSAVNAHPHTNADNTVAIVMNGIIENYIPLKEQLIKHGYTFESETDTEVLCKLIDYYYEMGERKHAVRAIRKVMHRVEGSYAMAVIFANRPDTIYCARKDCPLIVGNANGASYCASDVTALLKYTRDVYYLDNQAVTRMTPDGIEFFNYDGEPLDMKPTTVEWDAQAAEKGGYEHFMLKEIYEQPQTVRETLSPRLKDGNVVIEELGMDDDELRSVKKIYIVACGSAYHVGMTGKYVIEGIARIPVEVDLASEFRYRDPILEEDSLLILVSQSGETADTLAALRLAKERGVRTLGIVNVVGSSVAREADNVMYTWAGPEIAVATTKAYSCQLIAIYLLAMRFGIARGKVSAQQQAEMVQALKSLPDQIGILLEAHDTIQRFANRYVAAKDIFFIGRGEDYAISMEGSLKLKEISYIHSEAYAAGELKHGTISLIEEGTLVAAVSTQVDLYEKIISNMEQVKSRGAFVLAVTNVGNTEIEKVADYIIHIPVTYKYFANSLAIIPLQLFSYYIAVARGCDVDKPRNLAKSVTVE